MSKLYDFLNPVSTTEEREVVISKRFVQRGPDGEPLTDADGNMVPRPFKIRSISQAENDALIKKYTRKVKINGQYEDELDDLAYSRALILASTVDPDFRDTELCEHFGTLDPMEVPGRMLFAGEYGRLSHAILDLSGFNQDDDVIDEAKN